MKRILIVGPRFYGYSQSVAKAFEHHGFNVELFDDWTEGSVDNFREKIIYNLSADKNVFFSKKYESFNKKIRARYAATNPEMVFIIRGAILTEETLRFMKGSMLVLWMMDSIFTVPNTLRNIHLYDHVFLFEKEDIQPLKDQHAIEGHFLPLALDESVYFPIPSKEKPIDMLFVGNLYEKRVVLFNRIIERFPELNFKIYGFYFSKLRNLWRYFFRKDKQYYTNSFISPSELNKLYSKTKICLNIHHSQSVYGVNQRFFEVCGAGTLQVCDRHGFISDNFRNGEIIIYDSDDELFTLIEAILADYESYAEKIGQAYKEVVAHHTFDKRIQYILKTINIPVHE
ncbi:MAG TPA: glycosyltransferase [Ferruginibacter sp.]|jgi:spore maturation protein CgeB|nr:glycosyltransferase [Ferruginibacter sp.]